MRDFSCPMIWWWWSLGSTSTYVKLSFTRVSRWSTVFGFDKWTALIRTGPLLWSTEAVFCRSTGCDSLVMKLAALNSVCSWFDRKLVPVKLKPSLASRIASYWAVSNKESPWIGVYSLGMYFFKSRISWDVSFIKSWKSWFPSEHSYGTLSDASDIVSSEWFHTWFVTLDSGLFTLASSSVSTQ